MASPPSRRPGLWAEIALALALITLTTILLNAGVYWLLIKTTEAGRRTDLALSLARVLVAQLEVEARDGNLSGDASRQLLSAYRARDFELEELWLVGPDLQPLATVAGEVPRVPDAGLREALYGREVHTELKGELWGQRSVAVTAPVAPQGRVLGAVRVRMPMMDTPVPGGAAAFVLGYTIFSGFAIGLFGFSLFRRRLIRPVARIQESTDRIAAGDFGHTLTVDAASELQALCGALNTLSVSLAGYRIRTVEQLHRLEEANREIREAQEALVRSEKLAGVGRLAAGLAHEVGNPLSAVLGYMELLQQDLGDPELERDLVNRSRKELERIHGIIRQLLDYARAGSGRVEDVAVEEAAREAIETVRHQPAFRELRTSLLVESPIPSVRIEPDKLHQVLVNLLLNAVDALRDATEQAVEIRIRPLEEGVELQVLDTGHGFSPVALDRAFEPFFTTRDVGEGTGLGLATCREVIESAGGTIALANRPERGAVVTVRLPAAPGAAVG